MKVRKTVKKYNRERALNNRENYLYEGVKRNFHEKTIFPNLFYQTILLFIGQTQVALCCVLRHVYN